MVMFLGNLDSNNMEKNHKTQISVSISNGGNVMSEISRGIICRICTNNKDGVCVLGNTEGINRKDECWTFQDRNKTPGLAEASDSSKSYWSYS